MIRSAAPALSLLWLAVVGAVHPAVADERASNAPAATLTAPAVDTSVFREGEVRRRNERYGEWSLDCDEIVRLDQRFCSLRALARDATGEAAVRLTVSTDERGRPAALLDLPFGTDVSQPITIAPARSLVLGDPSTALAPSARRLAESGGRCVGSQVKAACADILRASLRTILCDAGGCQAVWPLSPVDIAALRAGAGIEVSYTMRAGSRDGFALHFGPSRSTRKSTVSSSGFGDAINASLRRSDR